MSNNVDYKFSETPGPVIEGSFEVKQQTPIQVNYMYIIIMINWGGSYDVFSMETCLGLI